MSNIQKSYAANFRKLNEKEQMGVLRKTEERASLFPRIYAAYLKLIDILKSSPKSREERYQAFLKDNPYVKDDIQLVKNLYVPFDAGQALNLTLLDEIDHSLTEPAEKTIVPIDDLIKTLEEGLAKLELEQ
jgi:hypothetical protein